MTSAAEPGLLTPRVLIPFIVVSLIWGSTWLVIRGQLGIVPASWSLTYRFAIAAAAMFLLGLIMRQTLRIDRTVLIWTVLIGLLQFLLNFNFVYAAEGHITSGLVAVIFALLIVPNAVLGKYWLGRNIGRRFVIGSTIAVAGVALLLIREYRLAPIGGSDVLVGVALALCGIACVSVANVMQALPRIACYPTITILAWAMLWGALANAAYAYLVSGAPVFDPSPTYVGGLLYLAIIGSVVTFPLYFRLVNELGPGKAAYTGVVVPVVAMLLSSIFEGYTWSLLAASGASLALIGLVVSMTTRKNAKAKTRERKPHATPRHADS